MAPGIRPQTLLALSIALLSLVLAAPPLTAHDGTSGNRASITKPPAGLPPSGAGGHVETACGTISGAINCGDVITNTTVGAVNVMGSYSCVGWNENGPEDVYSLTIPPGNGWTVNAMISNLSADLDIFILGPAVCNSNVCVAYGDSEADLPGAVGGATYYVIVDGFSGASSDYTLDIYCTAPDGLLQGQIIDIMMQPPGPPCTPANVHVEPIGMDLGVDPATGNYGPAALAPGVYDLTATVVDYPTSPAHMDGVVIGAGQTTTADFDFYRAVVAVTPSDFLGIDGVVGVPFSETLTIINDGYWALAWELWELPYDLPWLAVGQVSGTIPELDSVDVDIYFDCPEEGDFAGDLLLLDSDPCNSAIYVPIVLSCSTGSDLIFEDGFESGDTWGWSWTVP